MLAGKRDHKHHPSRHLALGHAEKAPGDRRSKSTDPEGPAKERPAQAVNPAGQALPQQAVANGHRHDADRAETVAKSRANGIGVPAAPPAPARNPGANGVPATTAHKAGKSREPKRAKPAAAAPHGNGMPKMGREKGMGKGKKAREK